MGSFFNASTQVLIARILGITGVAGAAIMAAGFSLPTWMVALFTGVIGAAHVFSPSPASVITDPTIAPALPATVQMAKKAGII